MGEGSDLRGSRSTPQLARWGDSLKGRSLFPHLPPGGDRWHVRQRYHEYTNTAPAAEGTCSIPALSSPHARPAAPPSVLFVYSWPAFVVGPAPRTTSSLSLPRGCE